MRKFALLIVVAMLVVGCGPPTNTPDAGRGAPYLGTWDLSANATLSLLTPDGGTEPRACTYEWTFELAPTEQQLVLALSAFTCRFSVFVEADRARFLPGSSCVVPAGTRLPGFSTGVCSVGAGTAACNTRITFSDDSLLLVTGDNMQFLGTVSTEEVDCNLRSLTTAQSYREMKGRRR